MIVFWDANWVVHIVHNQLDVLDAHKQYGFVENWQVRVVCLPGKPVHESLDVHGNAFKQADLGKEPDIVTCLACMGNPKWF